MPATPGSARQCGPAATWRTLRGSAGAHVFHAPVGAPRFLQRRVKAAHLDHAAGALLLFGLAARKDVERVACLAFYLTHYRETPEFTTLDISKINTEAAQRKLANATVAVNNASQYGYLVPAGKGMKQISASGERYVQALPDYEA